MIRRALRPLVAAVLALGLVACSTPLPTPSPDPTPTEAGPALSVEQVERVLADIAAVLEVGDAELAQEQLTPRVTGPALRTRAVEYALRLAGDETALTPIPSQAQTVIAPATDEWPRTVMVVTEPPEDLQPPLLLTLVQESPREPFLLWSWARLFPGVETPSMAQPEIGSPPVAADSTEPLVPPGEVVARYVDVLTSGEASVHAPTFAPDPLRTGIASTRDAFAQLVGANGTLAETYTAVAEAPTALATADGGAVVVGAIDTVTGITLVDSTLTLGDQNAALLGTPTVASNLTITWLSTVVFYVPPAGSTEQVQMLGAEHTTVQVAGQ